ncbi:MAG TPA: outer membrane beta-barrel protein, partial [Candidatus Krumholzibacteria bacterium]|nr:outer membrane beta-barrel protein [Candidatus Krumholzibacteria bacterium]
MTKLASMVVCAALLAGSYSDAEARKSYAGVKGGVNIGDVTGDDAEGLDKRNGFIGGAFYGIDFTDDFGVRLDGLYVQKGAEGPFVAPGDDHAHETVVRLDYLELPVLCMVGFPTGDSFAVNLFLGP